MFLCVSVCVYWGVHAYNWHAGRRGRALWAAEDPACPSETLWAVLPHRGRCAPHPAGRQRPRQSPPVAEERARKHILVFKNNNDSAFKLMFGSRRGHGSPMDTFLKNRISHIISFSLKDYFYIRASSLDRQETHDGESGDMQTYTTPLLLAIIHVFFFFRENVNERVSVYFFQLFSSVISTSGGVGPQINNNKNSEY